MWISVKDRLPEEGIDVLTCCVSKGGENTTFEKYESYHAIDRLLPVGFRTDVLFYATVTHWMPLPPLPEQDKKMFSRLRR
jgi:hypothetical protein